MNKKINGKKKGNKFELDVAQEIAARIGLPYGKFIRRTPGSGSMMCRADLFIHEKYRARFPYYTELKSYSAEKWHLEGLDNKKFPPRVWYNECKSKLPVDPDYDISAPVLLVFKKNGMKPLVMLKTGIVFPEKAEDGRRPDFYLIDNQNDVMILPWADFLELYVPKWEKEKVDE